MSPTVKKTKKAPAPSLNLYRRIAVGFVVAVALMLAAVLYVSAVSATIHVKAARQTVKTEFLADVVETPTRDTEVRGRVVSVAVGKTASFEAGGDGMKEVEEKSSGTVTIRNTSSRVQPLVATTRLLSPGGILFRLDETVTVPANGLVEAAVHADVAGASGDVVPSRFVIPGLSESLQKLIYAESSAAFTGGVRRVSVISQQDVDRSALALRGELEEDAKAALREQAGEAFEGEAFSYQITEQTSDVPAGTEASAFALTMTIRATGVFYERSALEAIASRKLHDALAPGKEFVTLNAGGLQASVDKADPDAGMANVRVYLDGEAVVSPTSASLDPSRFVGMTEAEIGAVLAGEALATDVAVEFTPFWMNRVPQFQDHVYVEIE